MTVIRRAAAIVTLAVGVGACEAYEPPSPPVTPTSPGASTVPTHIVLTASTRPDQRLDVAATVLSADGHGVPSVSVALTIGAGTITPPTTPTDQFGVARAVAVSTAFTTIKATIGGGIIASADVLRSPP